MINIGITGQSGFIGWHLYHSLQLLKDEFSLIEFDKSFFENETLLDSFVKSCDVIVHLAAKNRDVDQTVVYNVNVDLSTKLVHSLKRTNSRPNVIFSSSTQEQLDNPYGKSKTLARNLLESWALEVDASFSGLVIPNVFGPFCKPFYNSVVATFCHQLIQNESPQVHNDSEIRLIYVGELVNKIIALIRKPSNENIIHVTHTATIGVKNLLSKLQYFKDSYFDKGIIPKVENIFDIQLFNTFRSYINPESRYPVKYIRHDDERGLFTELIRIECGGQFSFSTTLPGITRGNHFHTRKIERFSVISGEAIIQLRKFGSDKVFSFCLSGKEPSYVDMPIWYIHNITNIGKELLYTTFWINEFYDSNDPDTYFEKI